jgi:hypothetical protein
MVTKIAVPLIVFVAALSANPVMPVIMSEIQTAPDSLERIELHSYIGDQPLDLSGAELVTNAGTAVIDSGLVLYPESNYVVIDSTNTTGVFSLGDESDHIRLSLLDHNYFELRYPANPFRNPSQSWAPPPGMSASIHQWWEWQNGEWWDEYTWYVDGTPTFGAPNDDTLGGITGYVYGDDGPLTGAAVRIAAAQGTAEAPSGLVWPWPPGYFAHSPTGPGEFVLSAEYPGYLPYTYPETIGLPPNGEREINIRLQRPDAVAEQAGDATVLRGHQRGRMLVLDADRPGIALVSVYDNLGRLRASEKVALVAGKNDLALPSLRSGVYFVSCGFGQRVLKTKFLLYRAETLDCGSAGCRFAGKAGPIAPALQGGASAPRDRHVPVRVELLAGEEVGNVAV